MTMSAVAHALAEPHRREILDLIRLRERTVGDIAGSFAVTRPAISQHLRVLERAELVTVRAEGRHRYYRARPEGLAELRQWVESFWRTSLGALKTEVERDLWGDDGPTAHDRPPADDGPPAHDRPPTRGDAP
jgi:DNA-binding transcriptional ArsR family regulator